jgi:hypothetical protein
MIAGVWTGAIVATAIAFTSPAAAQRPSTNEDIFTDALDWHKMRESNELARRKWLFDRMQEADARRKALKHAPPPACLDARESVDAINAIDHWWLATRCDRKIVVVIDAASNLTPHRCRREFLVIEKGAETLVQTWFRQPELDLVDAQRSLSINHACFVGAPGCEGLGEVVQRFAGEPRPAPHGGCEER